MSVTRTSLQSQADVSVHLSERGVMFGADALLMRRSTSDPNSPLAMADRERLIALLSVVSRRPLSPDLLHHVEAASTHWQSGDRALAQIRLALSPLPRLTDAADTARLQLAVRCSDEGVTPHHLLNELSLATTALDLLKFNPNHVPAGNSQTSGRFTSGSGESVAYLSPSALAALVRRTAPSSSIPVSARRSSKVSPLSPRVSRRPRRSSARC